MTETRERNPAPIVNAMSVDVEDYFQVSAFENQVSPDDWDRWPARVEANTDRLLQLFADHGIHATFFTLGWVAERYPGLVRRIVEQGHELASHGWSHRRVNTQTPEAFREDVTRTRALLEDLGGVPVVGYRAASYSIGHQTPWAHQILAEAGYRYSSSVVPIRHDLYGMPDAPRFAYRVAEGRLLEIPVTTLPVAGRNYNFGGGGWFRLFPYRLTRWALAKVNREEGQPCIFYLHPWEIDPDQPRMPGASYKARFRHYLNLDRTFGRLERLLKDFRWDRMDRVFLEETAA